MAYVRKRIWRNEHHYWKKKQLPPEIEKSKYREFLLDADYKRPNVPAANLHYALTMMKEGLEKISDTELEILLMYEKYLFFTIEHMASLNIKGKQTAKEAKLSAAKHMWRLYHQGLVHKVIRNWDLDDAEYKQRFGNDVNRHNYKRRYGITAKGKELCDKFYEHVADD